MTHVADRDQCAPPSAFPWSGNMARPGIPWPPDTTLSGGRMPHAHYPWPGGQQLICQPAPYALYGPPTAMRIWRVACAGRRTDAASPPGGVTCATLSAATSSCSPNHANAASLPPESCRWPAAQGTQSSGHPTAPEVVAVVEIPAISSDMPSAASSPTSLLLWLQQRLDDQSCEITATKIQCPLNAASPLPLQGYNPVASNASSPLSCAAKSTVPWLIVCVVVKERTSLTHQQR